MENKLFRNPNKHKAVKEKTTGCAEQTESVLPGEPPACLQMTSEPSAET